jgi:hypothetical protein
VGSGGVLDMAGWDLDRTGLVRRIPWTAAGVWPIVKYVGDTLFALDQDAGHEVGVGRGQWVVLSIKKQGAGTLSDCNGEYGGLRRQLCKDPKSQYTHPRPWQAANYNRFNPSWHPHTTLPPNGSCTGG